MRAHPYEKKRLGLQQIKEVPSLHRYKSQCSAQLVTEFPAINALLFRAAALAALRKDFLQAEETATRLEKLFRGPYGYDPQMLQLVRGSLKDLFDYFPSCHEAQQLWRENAADLIKRSWAVPVLLSHALKELLIPAEARQQSGLRPPFLEYPE